MARRTLLLVALGGCLLAIPAGVSWAPVVGTRVTHIVSPPDESPASNGPSDSDTFVEDRGGTRNDPIGGARPADHNVTFSQDNRKVKYVAYDSTATNLVSGDTNGKRDVFVMTRKHPGTGSTDGTLSLGSVSSSGKQANADSMKPSLDGISTLGQRAAGVGCLAFQSKATNLDSSDKSSDWDIYLRNLKSHKTVLASPGKSNAKDGVVDGWCERVSFEAGGKVYVYDIERDVVTQVASGKDPDIQTNGQGVAFDQGGQVWYQALSHHGSKVAKDGGKRLVSNSATNKSKGGNGVSSDPNLNNDGLYVVFESKATDLCIHRCRGISEDRNGHISDVFRRTMGKSPTGGADEMEMVSYDGPTDTQGDLESDQVHITGHGEQAVFRSFANNLRDIKFDHVAESGPFMHVYFWNFPRERLAGSISGESKCCRNGEFHHNDMSAAFSFSPQISNRGTFIGFSSDEEGESGERNGRGTVDAFIRFMGLADEPGA
ncbi:MAG TPA: hypothetical protein VF752_16355 [Thermoleophilaceae bacterium]